MRTLTLAAQTALTQPSVPIVMLVEMLFAAPDRIATGGWDIVWAGNTYTASGAVVSIEQIVEAPGDPQGLRLTISGVPTDRLALALQESTTIQGVPINIYVSILDPATYAVLDATLEWSGRLDTMAVSDGGSGEATSIQLTAEHIGIDLIRSAPTRWTHVDQQRLFPGDLGLQYIAATAINPLVWPAASFFKVAA